MPLRTGRGRHGSGAALVALALAGAAPGCGSPRQSGPPVYAALVALPPQLLVPGDRWRARLVEDGTPPVLVLAGGRLPEGLELDANGTVTGRARRPGQTERFEVAASTPDGEPLGSRTYAVAVGVEGTNLTEVPHVQQDGDALQFSQEWGRPIYDGFGWDPLLRLLWPLKVGTGVAGRALASPDGAFTLVVAGPDVGAAFELKTTAADPETGVVVQLSWAAAVDLDLRVVAAPALGGAEASAASRVFPAGGPWVARFELDAAAGPGAEAAVLAATAPAGRYALVATKAGGDDVKIAAWLAVRARDGKVLADERFDLFLSDVATGTVADELARGRQSWAPLGTLVTGAGGVRWHRPGLARDPFSTAPEAP